MTQWTRSGNTPRLKDVRQAITDGDTETIRRFQSELTTEGEPDMASFNASLMKQLDEAFTKVYMLNPGKKNAKVLPTFLGRDEEAKEHWTTYMASVLDILHTHKSSENSNLPAGFTARAVLSLCWMDNIHPFPILTTSVIDAYHMILSDIKLATTEVRVPHSMYHENRDIVSTPRIDLDRSVEYNVSRIATALFDC